MSVCQILPNIWLGDIRIIKNKVFFDEHNISVVINCTKDIPFYSNYTKNIRISVNDSLEDKDINLLFDYIPKAVECIHDNVLKSNNILIHCYAGKQRSASIVVAYLMKYGNMNLKDAILSVCSKRDVVFTPGINFKKTLIKYQHLLSSNI